VQGAALLRDPAAVAAEPAEFFAPYTLVIATSLPRGAARALAATLYAANIPLLLARAVGLLGEVRASFPELRVLDAKPDARVDAAVGGDLRIVAPFPALAAAAAAVDFAALDSHELSHVPYVLLLVRALGTWRAGAGAGPRATPRTPAEKAALRAALDALDPRAAAAARGDAAAAAAVRDAANWGEAREFLYFAAPAGGVPGVPEGAAAVLAEAAAARARGALRADAPPFWLAAAALADFSAENHGALPVSGALPDMAASTERFVALQRLYFDAAAADAADVAARVDALAAAAGAPPVPREFSAAAARGAKALRVFRCGAPPDAARDAAAALQDALDAEAAAPAPPGVAPAPWEVALRGADEFAAREGRWPGEFGGGGDGAGGGDGSGGGGDGGSGGATGGAAGGAAGAAAGGGAGSADDAAACERDTDALLAAAAAAAREAGLSVPAGVLARAHAAEVVRAGAAELHATAAIVGGVAAQEAVKIIAGMYEPVRAFFYNGVAATSRTEYF
jgi:amyloid beta precursor protein binding protein 1